MNAQTNIQAQLAAGFLVINVDCSEGSTIVDFEIVAEEGAAPEITVEESLAELITDIEDPAVEVFPDLVDDLGAVDSVVDETEIVSLQPTDADGADIVGWFSRTGSRVDFDDFFVFAEGFGRTVDSEALDVLDIAGPNQGPPDGLINFNDFFRFADDFGKTVANAAEIQDILLAHPGLRDAGAPLPTPGAELSRFTGIYHVANILTNQGFLHSFCPTLQNEFFFWY